MNSLVVLIVMVLAAAAGWYGGSHAGHDALQALAKAKEVGEQAQAAQALATQGLTQRLASLSADYEQGRQKLAAEHTQAQSALSAALAGRDQRIAELSRARSGKQAEIQTLRQAADSTSTTPDDRQRLLADIARLEKVVADQQVQVAGLECAKVVVPAELLAPLRGSQP